MCSNLNAISSAQQALQPAVSWVTGDGDDQSPCHHSDEGFQNAKAGGNKQEDKPEVNGDFDGSVQMRLLGRRSVNGYDASSHTEQVLFGRSLLLCPRPARSAGCPGHQLLFQAFVAASTPNAMMMPVVSNPSTAMKMAMILDFLLVGRKSP